MHRRSIAGENGRDVLIAERAGRWPGTRWPRSPVPVRSTPPLRRTRPRPAGPRQGRARCFGISDTRRVARSEMQLRSARSSRRSAGRTSGWPWPPESGGIDRVLDEARREDSEGRTDNQPSKMTIQNRAPPGRLGGEVRHERKANREHRQRDEHQDLEIPGSGHEDLNRHRRAHDQAGDRSRGVWPKRSWRSPRRRSPTSEARDGLTEEAEGGEEHRGHGDREVAEFGTGRRRASNYLCPRARFQMKTAVMRRPARIRPPTAGSVTGALVGESQFGVGPVRRGGEAGTR